MTEQPDPIRERIRQSGLAAMNPIHEKLQRDLQKFGKKPGTVEMVLPIVLRAIDNSHAAFILGAVDRLRNTCNAELLLATAETWIEQDAARACIEEYVQSRRLQPGTENTTLEGAFAIAYCCGIHPGTQAIDPVLKPITERIKRLIPAKAEIRRLFRESGKPAQKWTNVQLALFVKEHPKITSKELAKLSGWSQSELSRGDRKELIKRARTLDSVRQIADKRDLV